MAGDGVGQSVAERLAGVARRVPDRTAVEERDATESYAALDSAATAIACGLQRIERLRTGFVALLFEDKIPAIEAIFGASRCGRAYVPLDAGDPDDRLRLIMGDSEPAALLTQRTLRARAQALAPSDCAVITIDDIPRESAIGLRAADQEPLSNLYYTSGSTGIPKGVCQTQRNVLYFADAYARTLAIREADRVSLLYTMSFSASMMDMFAALFNGATLCAYDVRGAGVAGLADWLDRERISVLHAVPTVFRGLAASLGRGRKLEHLRAIDLGGESVFDGDAALFRAHTRPDCILINHLAATEANVIAQYVVTHGSACPDGMLPVGKSPDGVSVQIRRRDGTRAAVDEVGNLVVSSAYLSPGYWRRPDLNATAFEVDPNARAARRYLTGDLARIDAEGNLHFLGRHGSRVKIRGQSIELNEVEAALSGCPGVAESAVIAVSDKPGGEPNRLVAYLVAAPAVRDPLLVRRYLAKRLPSYMLPQAFVFLGAMPLTATGKIDRNALARIPPQRSPSRAIEPPRNALERAVAEIFERLLRQKPIGRDDDFFLLGGDSMSLMELQAQLLEWFGVSVSKLYEDATVAGIAARVARGFHLKGGAEALPVLFPIKQGGSAPPMFIVHGRLGQPFISPHFLELLGDDFPVWAFQARGLDGRDEPHATVEAMAADYLNELRKLRPHGPYFLAALCAGALIAALMARALRDAGEVVLPLLLFDPPERRTRATVKDQDLLFRIKARKRRGRSLTPIDDPRYESAAVRTARAFELAIWQHEPTPYDGQVFALSSRQRMTKDNPAYLRKVFSGPIERFEVGATHEEAIEALTDAFIANLRHCLERILAEAGSYEAYRNVPPASLRLPATDSRIRAPD